MKYKVKTRSIVEREYEYEFEPELPIEPTVADRVLAASARNGQLMLLESVTSKGVVESAEKVYQIERDGQRVYPRVRKQAGKVEAPTLTTLEDE